MRRTWKKADRVQAVLEALEAKPRSIADLCSRLGLPHAATNHRAILRDLDDLKVRGCEFKISRDKQPKYTLVTRPPRALQPSEALAAHIALRMLSHHAPNPPNSYRHALEKITLAMPEDLRMLAGHEALLLSQRPHDVDDFEKIANCWLQRRAMRFEYFKAEGEGVAQVVELETYFVEVSRQNFELYVIGRRRNHDPAVRTYSLRRIKRVTPLGDHYEIPNDFDPKKFLSNAWGVIGDANPIVVRLRFDPSVRPWLKDRPFPGVLKRETLDDGSELFTIQTGTDQKGEPRELMPWIRGWGSKVEVVAPASVRQLWLNDAQTLVHRFGGSK